MTQRSQCGLFDKPLELKPGERYCTRCLNQHERDSSSPVRTVEWIVGLGGRLYAAGLCAECWDREWSARHKRRVAHATAAGDHQALEALARTAAKRIACGRRVYE